MAKKFHPTDGNLLHHDQHHPYQPNAHHSSISSNTPVNSDSIHYVPPEHSADEQADSDVAYLEKHVEFTEEIDEETEDGEDRTDQQQKLHRRDTPHHLKNKRILSKNGDSATFDVRTCTSPSALSVSFSASDVAKLNEILADKSRKRSESLVPSLELMKSVISRHGTSFTSFVFFAHFQSIPNNGRLMTMHDEQLTLIIRRSANVGLGISIAGGIGSTPYKDNDYVSEATGPWKDLTVV